MNNARYELLRKGILLEWFTILWNCIEAFVAVGLGFFSGSIALIGFGFDSVIEVASGVTLLWRLSIELKGGDEKKFEQAEKKASLIVGVTFFLLAFYIMYGAGMHLWKQEPTEESIFGIILAAASLVIMPLLAMRKIGVAKALGSKALEADAKETIACSYLSFTLLLGLVLNALYGLWWADPAAALLMTPWLLKEGWEGIQEAIEKEKDT
jgi:cation diffusion facilitator family transporter